MTQLSPLLPQPSLGGGFERTSQLLLHYRPEFDLGLVPISKQATFVAAGGYRASSAWAQLTNGRFVRTPNQLPRFDWIDVDGDGICERLALVVEDADTNLIGWNDLMSSWTPQGSASAAAGPLLGDLQTWLITDNDAVSLAYMYLNAQAVTGATAKGLVVIAGKGPTSSAGGWYLTVRDITAPANKLQGGGTWNADGTPQVVQATTGSYIGNYYVGLHRGVRMYAFVFATAAVTAGNTLRVQLGGASKVTQTGDVYFGGACLSDDPRPSSYIRTPTNASVTRVKEVAGWLVPYPPLAAQTWCVEAVERGALGISGAVLAALTDKNGANASLTLTADATGVYRLQHHNGSSSVASLAPAAVPFNRAFRLFAWLSDDGSVQLGQQIGDANGVYGALSVGSRSNGLAFASSNAWAADAASIGYYLQPSAGLTKARTRLLDWKVAAGTLSDAAILQRW